MPRESSNRSKALAKMMKQSTGSYDRVKDTEARAGGRSLPGGLENELAQVTDARIDLTKNDDPMIYIYARAKSPDEYENVSFGFIYVFADSQFQSRNEAIAQFVNDMQLMGFATGNFGDEIDLADYVEQTFKKEKRYFLYNTARRAKGDGSYRAFPSGLPESTPDDSKPERPPRRRGKPAAKAPFDEGDAVETTGDHYGDGHTYTGIVQGLKDGHATVIFDDDNAEDDIPFDHLIRISNITTEPSSNGFEEGDAVITTGDFFGSGEEYEGTVTDEPCEFEDSCVVEFEDGKFVVPFANLEPVT